MDNIEKLINCTQNLKLLYIEDDQDSRETTQMVLSDIFKNIIIAENGKDGLKKYKEHNDIDLVITDINMPKLDGLSMCKKIKEIKKSQSIIVLTALDDINTVKKAIDIGIDGFINKPLEDIGILFSKLEQIVKKIEFEKYQDELNEAKHNKEKMEVAIQMIQKISHHWKQSLSVISTISSTYSLKFENDMKLTQYDYDGADTITKTTQELSNMLVNIESIDFNKVTIDNIDDIICVNNPIYKE